MTEPTQPPTPPPSEPLSTPTVDDLAAQIGDRVREIAAGTNLGKPWTWPKP
jgi:hypothetical protein